ncbi:MAG: hypothetical protein RL094_243 [Candidatus Parcubacteria bacterium]|jgi:hypothetical protein
MDPKVKDTYKEVEYTREMRPYMAYFQAIDEVFDLSTIDSLADLGCNNGRLMEAWKHKYPTAEVIGYDYFDWSKQYAAPSIKDFVHIDDLSKPFTFKKEYEIVNCSEVGEHIPAECEDAFLDNLTKATQDILLLTWSNQHEDHDGQHLNPQPKGYIMKKLEERGFTYWAERSDALASVLANKLEGIGYNWWAKNIMVFKKNRFAKVDSSYLLQTISTDNPSHKKSLTHAGLTKTSLQKSFIDLQNYIFERSRNGKGASILRASDGDYFFLRQIAIGSAKPGRRALTTGYDKIDIGLFRAMFWQNDLITLNLESHEHRNWKKFIIVDLVEKVISRLLRLGIKPMENGKKAYAIDKALTPLTWFGIIPGIIAFIYSFKRKGTYLRKALSIVSNDVIPSEAVYGLVSTKWVFRNFKNEIGIIASENKVALIKELMQRKEYQDYLGTDSFTDYIGVPEKGAADNILPLVEKVGAQIANSKAKIFLVGAGSSKIALLPLLRQYSNAVFIDVGAGIDAIAGIVCQDRPFFAEWTDYRLKSYNYDAIDFMDQGNPAWNNPYYKTVQLD